MTKYWRVTIALVDRNQVFFVVATTAMSAIDWALAAALHWGLTGQVSHVENLDLDRTEFLRRALENECLLAELPK
jgi:hypothetical protein